MFYLHPFLVVLKILKKDLVSISGAIFFIATILTFTFLFLFKNYQDYFRDYYISYLKSIYPHTFSTNISLPKPTDITIHHKKEIYIVAFENLNIHLHNRDKITYSSHIKSVGIRSFDEHFLPSIIKDSYKKNTIYINNNLYKKITSNPHYKKYISLETKDISFEILPFDSHLEDDFILLPNNIATNMFHQGMFNITNIYSPHSEAYIKQEYENMGISIITWQDRLPFFNRAFYNIFNNMFVIYTSIFLFLIFIFSMFFLSSLFEDIQKAISFILFFGHSFLYATSIVFIICILISLGVLICAYLLYFVANYFLMHYLFNDFENISTNIYHNESIYVFVFLLLFATLFVYFRRADRDIL